MNYQEELERILQLPPFIDTEELREKLKKLAESTPNPFYKEPVKTHLKKDHWWRKCGKKKFKR